MQCVGRRRGVLEDDAVVMQMLEDNAECLQCVTIDMMRVSGRSRQIVNKL